MNVEILLPGIVTLVLVLSMIPPSTAEALTNLPVENVLHNQFAGGAVFIASSDMVGVVGHILARVVLDRLSEAASRPWLIRRLSRGGMENKTNKEVNRCYRLAISGVLSSANDDIKKEVLKRRQTGRLVRSTLVPLVLTAAVVFWNDPVLIVVIGLLIFALNLLAYSYVEFSIYEECILYAPNFAETGFPTGAPQPPPR